MRWIKEWFRRRYENRISLPYGRLQFLGNFAFIQMGPDEYVDINAPSKRIVTDVRLTATGARPVLTFRYWPAGMQWRADMPAVSVIVEEKRTLIKFCDSTLPSLEGIFSEDPDLKDGWQVADGRAVIGEIVSLLDMMFLGFAFYQPLRAEHKKKKTPDAEKT